VNCLFWKLTSFWRLTGGDDGNLEFMLVFYVFLLTICTGIGLRFAVHLTTKLHAIRAQAFLTLHQWEYFSAGHKQQG